VWPTGGGGGGGGGGGVARKCLLLGEVSHGARAPVKAFSCWVGAVGAIGGNRSYAISYIDKLQLSCVVWIDLYN